MSQEILDKLARDATSRPAQESDNLYHVVFTTSHLQKHDPYGQGEKVRICGTYTSLPKAKAAAHSCLFDAGYEQEWFTTFEANTHDHPSSSAPWPHGDGVMVYAVAPDGEIFTTRVLTSPNTQGFKGDEYGKVDGGDPLYHVVQTTIYYDIDDTGEKRDTNIEGTFRTYAQARKFASTVLIHPEDGLTKESWSSYEELGAKDTDWDYGEEVVVHAVGENGENVAISVVKGQEMESVRLAEAARRME